LNTPLFLIPTPLIPKNVLYTKECDRVIYDRLVKSTNLAAVCFYDYQIFTKKQTGRRITEKLLMTSIKLLSELKKYLEKAFLNAVGKNFTTQK